MNKKYFSEEERKKGRREVSKKWRKNNKDKVAGEKRRYNSKYPEEVKNQRKNWRLKNKEYLRVYFKEYNLDEENKIKALVRSLTWNKYGSAKICSLCNSKKKVEHHHLKPYNVDNFIDLCKKCHEEVHK
jgi:hypothetical protein